MIPPEIKVTVNPAVCNAVTNVWTVALLVSESSKTVGVDGPHAIETESHEPKWWKVIKRTLKEKLSMTEE